MSNRIAVRRRRGGHTRGMMRVSDPATVQWLFGSDYDSRIDAGSYVRLSDNPEIQTACRRIAELIGSLTIHLMSNTEKGDIRIVNELSRLIDINPMPTMTRSIWMQNIVYNMLVHGNAVVLPHTRDGLLEKLEPVAAHRVAFEANPGDASDYDVRIDGVAHRPDAVLHFPHNPDPQYLWLGRGVTVSLREIANNLKQAQATENAFMRSEWKPSIIVKVDGLTNEFASPEGREKLLQSYVKPSRTGEPWLIPDGGRRDRCASVSAGRRRVSEGRLEQLRAEHAAHAGHHHPADADEGADRIAEVVPEVQYSEPDGLGSGAALHRLRRAFRQGPGGRQRGARPVRHEPQRRP